MIEKIVSWVVAISVVAVFVTLAVSFVRYEHPSYHAKVRITDGFYEGQTGVVRSRSSFFSYEVRIDNADYLYVEIPVSQMEVLK